ncbi:MAG TPA: SRPBCC domain-containing protein [Candidatus Saccharimonadales bacterium]|nr:SRPBCC domain-containing protein [Candidatus Saccharimonadales bacterium]
MTPELRIERVIDGPAEAVFHAWTTADGMRQWWGPGGFTTPYAEIDLRPGGSYLLIMQPPEGEPLELRGTYREIVRPRRLVYTWRWTSGVPDPHESVVSVDFEDLGTTTRVIVVHSELDNESPTDPYEYGWQSGLDKLAIHVAASPHITRGDHRAPR